MFSNISSLQKLLIVSHVVHYDWKNRLWAYGPYAREIELWADLFPQVSIACPLHRELPPSDCLPFEHQNITVRPQPECGGDTLWKKFHQILSLPEMVWKLGTAMHQADAIQVRCPGNLGLLGVIFSPIFSRRICAKYAGQWNAYPGEARSYRWQRQILGSRWFNGPVFVYGQWPNQSKHVIPFFTSVMTDHQMAVAKKKAERQQFNPIPMILFVGRLSTAKNVDKLLIALSKLSLKSMEFQCHIIGEGPEREKLKELSYQLGIKNRVDFLGGQSFEIVLKQYERADILVLASQTEGWPKAMAEGMAFGLVCIASNRGLVPQMLANERGLLVEPGDVNDLEHVLGDVLAHPEKYREMRKHAAAWAQQFTAEKLKFAFASTLSNWWQVDINGAKDGTNWRPLFN